MPIKKDYDTNWKEDKISVYRTYSEGLVHSHQQSTWGQRIGLYHKKIHDRNMYLPLILCGPIQIGFTTHDVIVVQKQRWVFLGRGGRVWRLKGSLLPRKPPFIGNLTGEGKTIWADTISRMVVDQLTPKATLEPLAQANARYRFICGQLVQKRVLEAASMGRKRSMSDFAQGVSPDWKQADLASPRIPTVKHSILLSLVLALEANQAADLIELAAFCEHKLPLYNRQSCIAIYQSSVELLAKLCPAWWSKSYLTPWHQVGSIEGLFKAQFSRIMNDAWTREVPVESIIGLKLPMNHNPKTVEMTTDGKGDYLDEWGEKGEEVDFTDLEDQEEVDYEINSTDFADEESP